MIRFATPCRTTGQNLVGLWRPSFTRVDNKLYLYGGGGHVTNDLHVLDLDTMKWDCVPAKEGVPPTKRYGHTAVLWKSYIVIFGGSNEFQEYCQDVIVFSLTKGNWFRPDIRGENVAARYLHSATVYKNKMYVYGGFAKNSECTYVLEELRILNLETWTWSSSHPVPARYNHSASLIGSKLWIYAGKDESGQTVSDLHSLDLETLKVLPHVGITGKVVLLKSQHFSEAIGNQLVVFGKYLNDATQTSLFGLWILDLEQLEWRKLDVDHCLEGGSVWNYFTITTPKSSKTTTIENNYVTGNNCKDVEFGNGGTARSLMTSDDLLLSRKRQSNSSLISTGSGSSNSLFGGGGGGNDHDSGDQPSSSSPCFVFLGNTEKERPQPYDHFRDVLSINVEYLGLFQVPESSLQEQMKLMLDNPEFSDFVIIPSSDASSTSGSSSSLLHLTQRKIHVHRMVLTTRWPHFKNIVASGMLESTRGTMTVPEPYSVVYTFLQFLYTDTVDCEQDYSVICEVLVMANMYLMERLKKMCSLILFKHHLRTDSCVKIFQAACMAQEPGLKKLAMEFIFKHCGAVMRTEGWMMMWNPADGPPTAENPFSRAVLEEFIDAVPDHASLVEYAVAPGEDGSVGKVEGGFRGPVSSSASKR